MSIPTTSGGSAVRYAQISADEAGQRIDNYLLRVLKGLPKSRVYRCLRKGEVRVNKGRVRPDYRLASGDSVRIPPIRITPQATGEVPTGPGALLESRILAEDARLIALDKPAGMAVHGGSGLSFGVIEALRAARPDAPYLELVHRLDRATSGCLLIARKRSALRTIHGLLRDGQVRKQYLALATGHWPDTVRDVTAPLATHQRRGGERIVGVSNDGKTAHTRFRVIDRWPAATLLEADLLTGRTHQLRVHAQYAGCPLAGDERYGDAARNDAFRALGLRRLFLHAHAVSFQWPEGGEFHISAPLPDDLRSVIDRLEKKR